jgi:hypothetical protein
MVRLANVFSLRLRRTVLSKGVLLALSHVNPSKRATEVHFRDDGTSTISKRGLWRTCFRLPIELLYKDDDFFPLMMSPMAIVMNSPPR